MNIVFVCSEYPYRPDQPTGGFGRYVATMVAGLAKAGHKVWVVCQVKEKKPVIEKGNIRIIPKVCLGSSFFNWISKKIPASFVKRMAAFFIFPFFWSLTVWLTLTKLAKEENIDIIEGGDFAAELFFYLLFNNKIPTVIKLHTPSFVIRKFNQEPKTFFYRIMELMEVYCLKKASCLNSPSKSLAEIVGKKIKRSVSSIIPYPVVIKKSKNRIKRQPYLVLYAGKLQIKKGVLQLLKAVPLVVKEIPQVKFIFVGPDTKWQKRSVKREMEDFIRINKLAKWVTISKPVSKDKLISFYRRAAITVVPSRWENFPNVCLEAMNYGSAVIASKVGGLVEIIEDNKNGLLVDPEDKDKLARAIVTLLTDGYLKKRLVQAARWRLKRKYHLKTVSNQTLSFYQKQAKV